MTSLDLSRNPISDKGGLELAQLLQLNPRIVDLDIRGTHLLRRCGVGQNIHTHALCPSTPSPYLPPDTPAATMTAWVPLTARTPARSSRRCDQTGGLPSGARRSSLGF